MKLSILLFFFLLAFQSFGQKDLKLSEAIEEVSQPWKEDSTACLHKRIPLAKILAKATLEPLTQENIIQKLGKPNRFQRFYNGMDNKYYIELIYYVFKDDCPKIKVEGWSIGFLFKENESGLLEIAFHDYCG